MVLASVSLTLQRAEELKGKLQSTELSNIFSKDKWQACDVLKTLWICQQQLQGMYQKILLLDLEFALDKKIEQDLWIYGFLNCINPLKQLLKDLKNPNRKEMEVMLQTCLDSANGFFISLLEEICIAFNLDMPFRRSGNVYGCQEDCSIPKNLLPSKLSCIYICQFCLIHLGDIARYKKQMKQAETFYEYAVDLASNNGMPYNQLAILEAARGDKLGAAFHYVMATYVRHPFPAAQTNLSQILSRYINDDSIISEGQTKLSPDEFLATFLKLHGLLLTTSNLNLAQHLVQLLITCLTAHIATESISSWRFIQTIVITASVVEGTAAEKEETRTQVQEIACHYLAGCLNAFLLPVYTVRSQEELINYFALPAIKLILDWLRCNASFLKSLAFVGLLQIWPSLSKLLNDVQSLVDGFSVKDYANTPLPEDWDLRGFLPLEKARSFLDFSTSAIDEYDENLFVQLRIARLISLGKWIAEQQDSPLMKSELNGKVEFSASNKTELPDQLLRELRNLSLSSNAHDSNKQETVQEELRPTSVTNQEKRPGILKNQDKQSGLSPRINRNVALNSIMNSGRYSDEMKQVTFNTPSKDDADKKKKNKTRDEAAVNSDADAGSGLESSQSSGGVLTLTKHQQQQMQNDDSPIKSSSHTSRTGKVVDRMEAARRDYMAAAAMLVLQHQQSQQIAVPKPSPMHNIQSHPHLNMLPPQSFSQAISRPLMTDYPPPTAQQPMPPWNQNASGAYSQIANNSPTLSFKSYPQNQPQELSTNIMFPWTDPRPPLPPASWWSSVDNPHSHQMPPPDQQTPTAAYNPSTSSYTYSLFNGPNYQHRSNVTTPIMSHQSLWLGPGPSPLERLLEQQRQVNMQASSSHQFGPRLN